MLRTFALLGLLHAAAGTDLTQDAAYMRNGLQLIEKGLGQIPGTARQVAINALLRDVQGSERLTPDQNDTLYNVTVLLNDILDLMLATKTKNQESLNTVVSDMALCNSYEKTQNEDLEVEVGQLDDEHQDCRDEEKVLFDIDTETCKELTDWLSGLTSPNCVKPDPLQTHMDQWTTFLTNGLTWFTTHKPIYVTKRDPCENSTAALEAKNKECNDDQHAYETRFCEFKNTREGRCAHLTSCTQNATQRHQTLQTSLMALSDQRVAEAGVIMHVICLIEKLRKGETFTNFETDCPVPLAGDLTDYANTEVSVPPKDECNTTAVDTKPTYDSWMPVGLEAAASVFTCF